jgi:hypothetical protein
MSKPDKMALAKAKARETTSFATTKDKGKKLLGEYINLPFFSPEPDQRVHDAIQVLPNHNNWPNNLISLIQKCPGHTLQHAFSSRTQLRTLKKSSNA